MDPLTEIDHAIKMGAVKDFIERTAGTLHPSPAPVGGVRMTRYDRFEPCPKCGEGDPGRLQGQPTHALEWRAVSQRDRADPGLHRLERIKVTCRACGYFWFRRPLDVHVDDEA